MDFFKYLMQVDVSCLFHRADNLFPDLGLKVLGLSPPLLTSAPPRTGNAPTLGLGIDRHLGLTGDSERRVDLLRCLDDFHDFLPPRVDLKA